MIVIVVIFLTSFENSAAAISTADETRARYGSTDAMIALGDAYFQKGGVQNLAEAYVWYRLADEWEGLPQYLFGRDRDALRRLKAVGGETAVAAAREAYQERLKTLQIALGRAERPKRETETPIPAGLTPGDPDMRRRVGRLILTFPGGVTRGCTGTAIDAEHVLTAAHCVEDHDSGDVALAAYFLPGYNGVLAGQKTAGIAERVVWDDNWRALGEAADIAVMRVTYTPDKTSSIALVGGAGRDNVTAPSAVPLGTSGGWFDGGSARVIGYPFEARNARAGDRRERLVDRTCRVTANPDQGSLASEGLCDMAEGASGGPLLGWDAEAGRVFVAGVTSFIVPSEDKAVFSKLTPTVVSRLSGWMDRDLSGALAGAEARDLINRSLYWLVVDNQCDEPAQVVASGRPYERNEVRNYEAVAPAGRQTVVTGPLSAPEPQVNVTGITTGRTLFGGSIRSSVSGTTMSMGLAGQSNDPFGRILVTIVCEAPTENAN